MFERSFIGFGAVMLSIGMVILLVSLGGEPEVELSFDMTNEANRVSSEQLAGWIIEGRRDFAIVDMRDAEQFAAGHIQGAVNCGSCHESRDEGEAAQEGEKFVDLSKKLVFYTETDKEAVSLPRILHDNPRMFRLMGGYASWQKEVLGAVSFDGVRSEEELALRKKRDAVRAYFSGERPAPAQAKLSIEPIRRRNAHKPQIADEGC